MGCNVAGLRRSRGFRGRSRLFQWLVDGGWSRICDCDDCEGNVGDVPRTEVLVHGVGVISPRLEVLCENGEFLLEGFDVCWVFVEEDLFDLMSVL